MKWILVLYWTLNGQPVLNHMVFEAKAPCEEHLSVMRKAFESLEHSDWMAVCQSAGGAQRSRP